MKQQIDEIRIEIGVGCRGCGDKIHDERRKRYSKLASNVQRTRDDQDSKRLMGLMA